MNADRDMRDSDAGSTTERRTRAGETVSGEVWARAAEQALRDMARAQSRAAAHDQSTTKPSVP